VQRRAIGIVRVSEVKGRDRKGVAERDALISPEAQCGRIEEACKRHGLTLIDTYEELDVSGGSALEDRTGLGPTLRRLEAGEAQVVVAGYFDRLFRSLKVQHEFVSRVEDAGGEVLAVDFGQVSHGTASQWLSSTMIGAVSEYFRRSAAERSREAQIRAVARGVVPWPNATPGYVVGDDGVLEVDPATRDVVAQAFELRADGATVARVREHLADHGIVRSYHGTTSLLRSRVVLGEIHFGDLVNLEAHEPIVERDVWQRVQRMSVSRGRKAKSDRLLARLGVLRCGTCGARMVVGTGNHGDYHLYRCPPTGDCSRRVTVSAELAERVVLEYVRAALADSEGRASAERQAREAQAMLDRAQADLDAALRAFAGFEDEQAARERLNELREVRDAAKGRADKFAGSSAALTINAADDWDRLTLGEKRALIRTTVAEAQVAPGRGEDRVSLRLVGEEPARGAVEDPLHL
jgi:site-specific DNA recombinase